MHICILNPSYLKSESKLKQYDDRTFVTEYLQEAGHSFEFIDIHKASIVKQIRPLIKSGKFDVFLNLCDGAWDDDTAGFEVTQTLEYYNVPFTGSDSLFYDPTREEMKLVCDAWSVKIPAFIVTSDIADITLAVKLLSFPMIVKHSKSYSSIGLHKNSRVESIEQLQQQATIMLEEFGEIIIEEFIDGREFTVLVAENPDDSSAPIVYVPLEFTFPEDEGLQGFKYFEMKWIDYRQMHEKPVSDKLLSEKLKDVSRKVFLGLNGTGYGRCDIRMDEQGEMYLLEINPNCGVFYSKQNPGSADFILLNDPLGHNGFIDAILRSAFNRVRLKQKWRRLYSKEKGFGLYATQDIQQGEIIIEFEKRPHVLATKSYMNRSATVIEKEWFTKYAYPISNEIWVLWSDKPQDWKPINHSCNPNSWLEGLNLVARQTIPIGSEITMEYATFMNEQMDSFECHCNSANCRKIIKGTDYNLEFMDKYENHCSDYIQQKRKAFLVTNTSNNLVPKAQYQKISED